MANKDLQIKLVLDAVNNMSGKLDQAARDLNRVTQAMDQAQRQASRAQIAAKGNLLDPNTWAALIRDTETLERRMNQLRSSGLEKIALGGALLVPVVATVRAAGDLGEVMNQIRIDIYDANDSTEEWNRKVELLRQTTLGLAGEVRYTAAEVGWAVDELARGNVEVQDIASGAARAAVYLAQASKGDVTPAGAAEAVAKLGNAWQLTGKEIEGVADTLARVDAASTASIPSLLEGFKYVSATASNLDLSIREVAIALGILNNAGLDGSTAGVTLNQMLQHLQPTTKAAQEMFEALGLSVEQNPFFDADGKLKPMIEIIRILRNATKDLTDQQKQLAFKTVFDERGARAVINLLKEGKNSYEDIESSLDRQMSLWDRIRTQNEGLNAQIDILKGNISTLLSEEGSPLADELTEIVKGANDAVKAFGEWSKEHPGVVSATLKITAAVGGLTAAVGALQLAFAGFVKVWTPAAKGLMSLARFTPLQQFTAVAAPVAATYGIWKAGEWVSPYFEQWAVGAKDQAEVERMRQYAEDIAEMEREMERLGIIQKDAGGYVTYIDDAKYEQFVEEWVRTHPSIGIVRGTGGGGSWGTEQAAATAGPVTINIYARDAHEVALEVKRVIDRPTDLKYIRSRMPLSNEPIALQE